jgi:hypothetical protein
VVALEKEKKKTQKILKLEFIGIFGFTVYCLGLLIA